MLYRKWTRTSSGPILGNILSRKKLFKRREEIMIQKFLLEVGFVNPRFYCMPKKQVGFIIATYEGEVFDWGLLSVEAL